MTSRERITRIFQGKEVDRPGFKLWGAKKYRKGDWLLSPLYAQVAALAAETTDLFGGSNAPFDVYFGANASKCIHTEIVPLGDSWAEHRHTFRTPQGDLHQTDRVSLVGKPGMTTNYPVQTEDDLQKLLSIPYTPYPFQSNHGEAVADMGDRGVVMFGLDHAGYALHRLTGSENLAYLSMDCPDLVEEVMQTFAGRIYDHTKTALESGIRAPFSWVGPEVLIPPLMSPEGFERYVFQIDKPLCDLIRNAGCHIWMHCHGKTAQFVPRFIEMGVDILNPLEPKPNGDVELKEIAASYGGKIGLEGNIEIQSFLQSEPEQLKEEIRAAVKAGSRSGRFILCPSAGYAEYPTPEQRYLDNLMLYLQYGLECVIHHKNL